MTKTFKLILLTRSVLENRTFFLNSLMKINNFSPAVIFFEPLDYENPSHILFLAKKISAYLSDNGLINSIITLDKYKNLPPQIPLIIAAPIQNKNVKSYQELFSQVHKEFAIQEILIFSAQQNISSKFQFLKQYPCRIINPVYKI